MTVLPAITAFAWIALGLTLYLLIVLCIVGFFIGADAGNRATELEYLDEAPEQDLEKAA